MRPDVFIKPAVVVSCDDNLVCMWQGLQPVYRSLDLSSRSTICEVACVDQDVAVWDVS